MTIPAMPMKEAALRYSPEMADAFQPTETERPATKKSWAVLERRADQKPIQIVAATVTTEKARIQGSTVIGYGWGSGSRDRPSAQKLRAGRRSPSQQIGFLVL